MSARGVTNAPPLTSDSRGSGGEEVKSGTTLISYNPGFDNGSRTLHSPVLSKRTCETLTCGFRQARETRGA